MYHFALALGLSLSYLAFYYGFPWLFGAPRPPLGERNWHSALIIGVFALGSLWISLHIHHDRQLANRVLHVLGGGAAGFLACFLAARDAGLALGRLRFFVFAALVVTALGVGNELV